MRRNLALALGLASAVWPHLATGDHVADSGQRWSYEPPASPTPRKYEGIVMNFLFPDFIAHGLDGTGTFFVDRIKKFCDETGAKATMTDKAFPAEYRPELQYDLDSGLNFYDAFNFFGSWMPGLVSQGNHLLKLTDYIKSAPDIVWSDILPAVRRGVCEFQNEIYMLPADGDVIVMIYRKDLLDLHGLAVPQTWEDWLAVSNYFRTNVGPDAWVDSPNRTLAQEGGAGACMMTKLGDWAYANLFAFLSTFLQAHGPGQGVFFDPITMEPLFNTPAAREALILYKKLVMSSTHVDRPCEKCTDDGGAGLFTMVDDMQAGKCMMGFNYMGPVKFIASGAFNKAENTIALAPVPGSTRVKGLDSDELVGCAEKESNCPYATQDPRNEEGKSPKSGETHRVNRATYYSGGGQSWAISSHVKDEKKRQALWEFFKGLIDLENSILSTTAADYLLDPFRQSTLDGLQVKGNMATVKFMENGWKWEQLGTMKSTLQTVFTDPNSVLDLKIVEGGQYIEETDAYMLDYFKGKLSVDEVIQKMTEKWKARTNTLGKSEQRNLYRGVLGLQPYFEELNCSAGKENIQGKCQPCQAGKFKGTAGLEPCTRCKAGDYQDVSGGLICKSCDKVLKYSTTNGEGYTSGKDCTCPKGSFWFRSAPGSEATCKTCGEGLDCKGGFDSSTGHHQPPLQAAAFATGSPEWDGAGPSHVYRCATAVKCPGGTPLGTCPDHRVGPACDGCGEGYYSNGQECFKCNGSGMAMTIIFTIIVVLAVLLVLILHTSREMSPFSHTMATLTLTFTMSCAAVQTLGAFRKLSIEWVEPMKSLGVFFQLVTFQIDILRPECSFEKPKPSMIYLGSLLLFPAVASALALSFLLAKVVGKRDVRWHHLVNAVGILFTVLNLSLTIVAALAWQCEENPDGTSSVVTYRNVICFTTTDHHAMMGFSVVALLVYAIGFLSLVVWVTVQYPIKLVSVGGMNFLLTFKFLFHRFSAERYYYAVVFAVRGLFVSILPVALVNYAALQVMFMGLVLILYTLLLCRLWPWRTDAANYIDVVFSGGLILILLAGTLLLDTKDNSQDQVVVQGFLIAIVVVCTLGAAGVLLIHGYYYLRPPKKYGIFLSHHKAGAAVLARWCKMVMQERVHDRIFLDSDDVDLLDKIIDTTAHDCKNVVVLMTSETLSRIWCAGEIASAIRNGTNVVLVACDDAPEITDSFLENLPSVWTDAQVNALANAGVELPMILDAYRQLREMPMLKLRRGSCAEEQEAVLAQALNNCKNMNAKIGISSGRRTSGKEDGPQKVHILGNMRDAESACACQVVKLHLQRQLQETIAVLGDGSVQPETADCCLLMLTRGVLHDPGFAAAFVAYQSHGVELVPVRADSSFVYPNPGFWAALPNGGIISEADLQAQGDGKLTLPDVEVAYKALFNVLALNFSSHGSNMIQATETTVLASRISSFRQRGKHKTSVKTSPTYASSGGGNEAKETVRLFL